MRLGRQLLVLGAVLAASVNAAGQTPDDWRADLASLAAELERRHPNLYHSTSRDAFQAALQALAARAATDTREQMVFGLARVLKTIGDGHTGLFPAFDTDLRRQRYAVEVFDAADGLVITGISPALQEVLGARIIRIGDRNADEFRQQLVAHLPADNAQTPRSLLAYLFPLVATHTVFGSAPAGPPLTLTVMDAQGRERRVAVPVADPQAALQRVQDRPGASWLQRRGESYWMEFDAATRTLFVQYNRADSELDTDPLVQFGARLVQLVEREKPARIVVDLRWNSGGSAWWSNILLNALIRAEPIIASARGRHRVPHGRLFVLIGPSTFSQGTNLALDLEAHTNATFVGVPTGGRPNVFSGPGRLTLPRTGLVVRYSNGWYMGSRPGDTRDALMPDIAADITAEDLRAGSDPAMRAILRPSQPEGARQDRSARPGARAPEPRAPRR